MKSHAAETAGHADLGVRRHRFTARLPDSIVGLSMPDARRAGEEAHGSEVLVAASALAQAEPWLHALEEWLGCGLVPELLPPGAPWVFEQHATGKPPSLDLTVHMPLSALESAPKPPPAALAEWTWQTLRCDLLLDAVPLTLADVQALEVGALVLLPAAFGTQWQGRLRPVSGQGGMYAARLYEQRGRLRVAAHGETASHPSNDHATVRFVHPLDVRLPHLLGWSSGKVSALDAPQLLERGAVVVHGSALLHERPLASGQLVPVGSGFAVRIDELFHAAEPAVPEATPST